MYLYFVTLTSICPERWGRDWGWRKYKGTRPAQREPKIMSGWTKVSVSHSPSIHIHLQGVPKSYLAPVVTKEPLSQYLLERKIINSSIKALLNQPVLKKREQPQCQQVYQQKPETLKYWFMREDRRGGTIGLQILNFSDNNQETTIYQMLDCWT